MALTKRGNTNLNIEIKNDLTNQIIRIRTGAKTRRKITKANIEIKTRTDTNIVLVPSRTKRNMIAVAKTKTKKRRAPRLARTRNTRAAAPLVRTRAKTRIIITNQVRALKTRTGKKKEKRLEKLYADARFIVHLLNL